VHSASGLVRKLCVVVSLVLALGFIVSPAAEASVKYKRHSHNRRIMRRTRSRLGAQRSTIRSATRPQYRLVSLRFPEQSSPIAPSTPPTFPPQDERRLPRQTTRTTAAVQGIIRDTSTRGVVGAKITLTNRASGAVRTISTDADGVFRSVDLAPGSYSLFVQGEGFENATHDDLRLNAGDVVTIEMTLNGSGGAAAPALRLPRLPELGPPGAAAAPPTAEPTYRELRRRPDAEP
jgi:hypothetical protein